MPSKRNVLKSLSLMLVQAFLLQQVAYAAPGMTPIQLDLFQKPGVGFEFPQSVAIIGDTWRAAGSRKTVFLIEDAHTNPSGQLNLAKALERILDEEKALKYVFIEAGVEDSSLSFFRPYGTPDLRGRLALPYINRGELHGEAYLDLTSDREFLIWGVEDMALYAEGIETYKAVARDREKLQRYLSRVETAAETLKGRIYGPSLKSLDSLYRRYSKEELPITPYF